jgi:hypothetical protein
VDGEPITTRLARLPRFAFAGATADPSGSVHLARGDAAAWPAMAGVLESAHVILVEAERWTRKQTIVPGFPAAGPCPG